MILTIKHITTIYVMIKQLEIQALKFIFQIALKILMHHINYTSICLKLRISKVQILLNYDLLYLYHLLNNPIDRSYAHI